jgi:hypothetical protein
MINWDYSGSVFIHNLLGASEKDILEITQMAHDLDHISTTLAITYLLNLFWA